VINDDAAATQPVEWLDVPVEGGTLAVARWSDGPAVAVAAHGSTSSHRAWSLVGPELDGDVTLLAPDLRGRADSAGVSGPYGMARHADDLRAVLDHVGAREAVVMGHSMGGFVAAVFATRHPDRTRAALLIDGGPALFAPPPEDQVDEALQAVIGPALARLDRRFASHEEHRAFWRSHPALDGTGAPPRHVDAYADHDLTGEAGAMRSKTDAEAVRADGRDSLANAEVHAAISRLDVPTVLLLAERGMLNNPQPLYADELVEDLRTAMGPLDTVRVPGTNHYTIVMSEPGARVIAHHLRRLAADGDVS
jgi:pimeloyl-ACP methyl ester carboxylesterase